MTTRTLNRAGQRSVPLAPRAALEYAVATTEPTQEKPHRNAAMPNAPVGYAWPHMKTPARFV